MNKVSGRRLEMVRDDQNFFETFKEKDTEVLGNTINTTKRFDKSEMFWREAHQVWAEELKFLAETSRLTETPLSGKGQTKGGLGLETQELRCLETLKRKFKKDVGVSDRNLERPGSSMRLTQFPEQFLPLCLKLVFSMSPALL